MIWHETLLIRAHSIVIDLLLLIVAPIIAITILTRKIAIKWSTDCKEVKFNINNENNITNNNTSQK